MKRAVKRRLDDLAIFGGEPAFLEPLHVGRPNVGDRSRFIRRVEDILDRRWLTNDGPYVKDFEKRVAEHVGVQHCVSMCNGTIALEIASRALGLHGEVIIPAFTFVATAHSLQWQEITPVFCDVEPGGYTIDPAQVERLITPRTTGIVGVHLWSRTCAVERLGEIAARRNLKLLFDAAHAFGCSHRSRMIGNHGNAEVFSFHATKFCNTFEGGAVVTNDGALAEKMRLMRNFGFAGYDNVIYLGINGKMPEVSAAMGLTGLESIAEFVKANQENYEAYREELASIPGIELAEYDARERNNYQYVIVEVDEEAAGINRDTVVQVLHAENILARRYFFPGCHRMEPYRSYFPHAGLLLPRTERLVRRVVSLPTGTAISAEEAARAGSVLRFVIANGSTLRARLNERLQVS